MLPWLMLEVKRRRYQKTLRFLALKLLIGYDEKQQLLWVLKRGEKELFRSKSTEPY